MTISHTYFKNRVLCHPLEDLGVTYTVHLWLVGKRVVDFLLVLIALFSPALTIEALWANICRNCAVWGKGGRPPTNFGVKKTRLPRLSRGVVCVILRLAVLIEYRRVTQRRTDTRTHADGYYPRTAPVKPGLNQSMSQVWPPKMMTTLRAGLHLQ